MFMRCGVILIGFSFTFLYQQQQLSNDDTCLRFLPPSSTGTIARVRVSTYVGGVHEDLTSLSPNPGDASEVAVGRPISAAHAGPCYSPCLRGGPPPRPSPPGSNQQTWHPFRAITGATSESHDATVQSGGEWTEKKPLPPEEKEWLSGPARRKSGCLDQRGERRCARGRSVGQFE